MNIILRNAVTSSSLCGILLLPKSHKRKRPQHAPEQTYRRISLRRSMLRYSFILFSYKRHRLHSVTSDNPTVGSVCGGMCRARSFNHSMRATSFHSIARNVLLWLNRKGQAREVFSLFTFCFCWECYFYAYYVHAISSYCYHCFTLCISLTFISQIIDNVFD